MDFRVLDLNNVSEQELIDCIDKNIIVAKMHREEIARLKELSTLASHQVKITPIKTEEKKASPAPVRSKDEEFEDEVDYYYEAIHNLTSRTLIENLEDFLPSKKHPYYERLMYRLQAEILREIKEIKDFIGEVDLSEEEIAELSDEIALSKLKISKIRKLLAPKEEQAEKEEVVEEKNLIFIPTQTGRIRVFDELESMPPEYYDELADLFLSIKNGTFKGVKRFRGENFARVSEVRGKLMRVIFDRIDKSTYAVLTIFAKKFDTSSAYRTSLESTVQSYIPMRDSMIEKLADQEFVELHKNLEIDLMRRLSPTKENNPVKIKEVSYE